MSNPAQVVPRSGGASHIPPLVISIGLTSAAALLNQPILMAAALIAGPIIWAAVLRPQLCVLIVVGILYTNLAVVAVRFHGAPMVLGMLAPLPLGLPLVNYLLIRGEPVIVTRTLPWIALFMLLQTFSMLFSADPKGAWPTMKNGLLEGLFLYLIVTNAVRGKSTIKAVAWCLIGAAALMGSISCLQWATDSYDNDYGGLAQLSEGAGVGLETERGMVHQRRVCGPIGEQNRYAQIMLMVVPIAFCQFQANQKLWIRGAACAGTMLTLAGCMLTFSRGAFVALAILVGVMLVLRMIKPLHLAGAALICLLAVILTPQLQARLVSIGETFQSVNSAKIDDDTDGAVRGRLTGMLAASRVFMEYPLLGVGPGRFNEYSRSHSREGGFRAFETTREVHCLYLELAAENGILGLGVFGILIAVSLRGLLVARDRFRLAGDTQMQLLVTGFFLALVAYLASALFLHLSYARYFWLMLALADVAALQAFLVRPTEATQK